MNPRHALPYELWGLVVRKLPRSDQRTCLLVSRTVHGVVMPILFSRILVFFGSWDSANDPVALRYMALQDAKPEVRRHNENTIALLRHIARTPEFASLVRELTVAAYEPGETDEMTRVLIEALRQLRDLRVFRYYGASPMLYADIMRALSEGPAPKLREMRFPLPRNAMTPYQPGTRRGRSRVNPPPPPPPMSWEFYFSDMQMVDTVTVTGHLQGMVSSQRLDNQAQTSRMTTATTDTLRHLSIPDLGWCLSDSRGPGWGRLSRLQTLELTNLSGYLWQREPHTIAQLFHHCSQLRSLSMLSARQRDIDALGVAPESLPRLESLKLSFYPDHAGWVDWNAHIVPFLREKKRLRRLDFVVFGNYSGADVLQVLTAIPNVEVLGLPLFKPRPWSADAFGTLDTHLPVNLSVLLLSGVIIDGTRAPPRKWVELLHKRKKLRYVHFLYSRCHSSVDLTEDLLKDPPESLELVGDAARLRWLSRACGTQPAEYSPAWPLSAVCFRSAADFQNGDERDADDNFADDCEWMLRHRDTALFDTFSPNGFGTLLDNRKSHDRR
ncbi:hypothetical protein K466DRAFT_51087 [Polyporus arcularius HHB13444]|uniref:F-box domain-containing protein n=1 Tax=Polyporus arcularius HHB13444 TaxID=1314778 RepID=A0A5C3PKW8_9APHY|nr:hypothetical protein K466DRAFT_51087 [Polyporus arcularius HHB13444]